MTQTSLANATLICFDTSALIYLVERINPYFPWLEKLFQDIESGDRLAMVSVVTEAEARVQPLRISDLGMLRKFEATLAHRHVSVAAVDRDIARLAGSVRADLNLGLPDAIIVATAMAQGCDALVGNDRDCARRVKAIPYVYLEEVVTGGPP